MEGQIHRMTALFEQLGLPSSPQEIRAFIEMHRPLPESMVLHEAPIWSRAQADFLREGVQADADWSELIDALSASLRATSA